MIFKRKKAIDPELDLKHLELLAERYVKQFTTEELVEQDYLLADAAASLLGVMHSRFNTAQFQSLVLSYIKKEINEREKQALIEASEGEFFSEDEVEW